MLEHAAWELRSEHTAIPRPVVIRLVTFVKVPRDTHRRKITRRAVFARDGWTCQYCGSRSNLTVDHVIPRSKGGPSSWENIVASCAPCNRRKGDHLPERANMHPRRQPDGAEPARVHPRRQPDDPGGVATMAARDGRRGRRGLSETGRRPSRRPRCAGRRRRPARGSSRAAAGEPVAGQPPARARRRARARAAPLGAPGLGGRRPRPDRRARGARARAAGRHARAGARARGGRPGRGGLRRPGAAHHARAGRGVRTGARRSGRSLAALAEIHAVDPAGIPPYRRYYEPERLAVPRGPRTARCGSARSRSPTRRRPTCPSASSTATSIPATRCGRARR